MKLKFLCWLVASVFCCLNSWAFITDYVTSGCTPGTWTYDLDAARSYAKKNNSFYIMVLAKEGGCGYCKAAATYIWNTDEFHKWAKDAGIPLVFANYSVGNKASKTFLDLYITANSTGIPALALVDGADGGTTLIGSAVVTGGAAYSIRSETPVVVGGTGVYISALSTKLPVTLADFWMNVADDTPAVVAGTTSYDYGTRPTEIKSDTGKPIGLWKNWEVNSLKSKFFLSGKEITCKVDDCQDWYKFENKNQKEQSYIVTCPTLTDKSKLGYLAVYTSLANAKKASAALASASAGKLPSDVTKYALNKTLIPMSELATANGGRGRDFTVPKGTETVYLAFLRRTAKNKENITLKYTFTLAKGKLDAFEFDANKTDVAEYSVSNQPLGAMVTNDCVLTVCRDTTGSKTTASVTITNLTAIYGTDYYFPSATYSSKTKSASASVQFGSTDATAKLPFKIISRRGVWTGDRTFSVAIAKDAKASSKKTTETVTIKEVDPAGDGQSTTVKLDEQDDVPTGSGVTNLVPSDDTTVVTNRLIGSADSTFNDQQDWFKLEKPAEGKIAYLNLKSLYKSASANAYKLIFCGGADMAPVQVSGEYTCVLPPKFFGDGAVYVCVSNISTTAYHCNIYELSVGSVTQPTVKFKESVSNKYEYASPSAKSDITYEVELDQQSASPYYQSWANSLPKWRTVDGTATNGVDFTGTSVETALTANDPKATWSLLVRNQFVSSDRSFTVELLPDDNGYYQLIGNTNIAVTIKGDVAQGNAAGTNTVDSTFVKATKRNLSYTNVTDEVFYSAVKANTQYVLGAENVTIKPADTKISVAVYTNANFSSSPWTQPTQTATVNLATNDLGMVTNCYAALCAQLDTQLPQEWCLTNANGVATNAFSLVIVSTNTVYAEYGNVISNVLTITTNQLALTSAKTTSTSIVTTYAEVTNDCEWVEYTSPNATWNLADLAEPAQMPMLEFSEDGMVKIAVSREADESVFAEYDLMLTEWKVPALSFTKSDWEYNQTQDLCTYDVKLSEESQLPVTFQVTVGASDSNGSKDDVPPARENVDIAFTTLSFVIPAGETQASVVVTNLMAKAAQTGIWMGDRAFSMKLAVQDDKVQLGKITTARTVLKSVTPEYEEGDSTKEAANNPLVKDSPTKEWKSYSRTLNGADVVDYFLITNVVAGTTYRFRLEYQGGTTNNLGDSGFGKVTFMVNGATKDCDSAALVNVDYDLTPENDGEILVMVRRYDSCESTVANPISLGYVLKVREWPWPTFAFDSATLSAGNLDNDDKTVTFTIRRTENCEGTNSVRVTLAALTNNAVSAISPKLGTTQIFEFLPGQETTNYTVEVVSPTGTAQGVWSGDWAFVAQLAKTNANDKVQLGANSNCVVTVADAVKELDWHDACGDDDWKNLNTNHGISAVTQTFPEARLNGSDAQDWYCFTGIESNATYYFECSVDKLNDLAKDDVTVAYYQYAAAQGKLVALTPKKSGAVAAISTNDLYVCVSRPVAQKGEYPSAAYTLSFHRISAGVYLTPGKLTVREDQNYAEVQIVCTNATELVLPVVAMVTAETQDGDTATAPSDYEAICVSNVWQAGEMGSVRTIRVPLTNRDQKWEGNETFHLRLEVESGAEPVALSGMGMYTNVLVTIKEANDPQYGTVAITGVGDPLSSVKNAAKAVYATQEGEAVPVQLRRRAGITGNVVLKWWWKDSAGTKVGSYFYSTNYLSGEQGYASCKVPVPVKSGSSAVAENWTLNYKIDTTRGVAATVYAGSPTVLTFAVADKDYGGELADYSLGDKSRVAFTSTSETWFTGVADGAVRSTTPEANKSVAMTAKVTGPGTLKFAVAFTDVTAGYLKVTGGDKSVTAKQDGEYAVHVSAGTKTLTFTFKRSSKDGANASVEISSVDFVPDAEFNGYGTFTGPVAVDGVPGLATMTVSTAGKTSGKFQCADRTWTFAASSAWQDGAIKVTAKCGKSTYALVLGLDAATGTVTNGTEGVSLELARKVWGDKPVAAGKVEALERFAGTYAATLTVDQQDGGALQIRLAGSGTIKVAGTLGDGTKVSASVPLLFTAQDIPWGYVFTAPDAYVQGWFAMPFCFDGETETVHRLATTPIGADDLNWQSKAKDADFSYSAALEGKRQ